MLGRYQSHLERLPTAMYAYNTSPSFRSTDYTPYYLLFGCHAKGPADLKLVIPEKVSSDIQDYVTTLVKNLEEAAEMADANIRQHQIKMKEYFDKSAHAHNLQEGDKVFLYVHVTLKHLSRTLRHPWFGGFVIHTFLGINTVKQRKLSDGKILKAGINVKRLKKCIDPKVRLELKTVNEVSPPLDGDLNQLTDTDIPTEKFDPFMATRSVDNDSSDSDDQKNHSQSTLRLRLQLR